MTLTIIRTANYDEMSKHAATLLTEKIRSNPRLILGLATGSTPKGLYKELVQDHQVNGTSYEHIRTVNLDEYIGISKSNPNSYHYFMRKQLFDHVDIPLQQTHIPDGTAKDLQFECARYDNLIQELGGVDLQILGIGHNGHIGFNEPGTPFPSSTHIVTLTDSTRQANARFFPSFEEVPTHAITMGIASITASRQIFLLASGTAKAAAIKQLLKEGVTEQFPASALKLHKNVILIADDDALQLI